MTYLQTFSRLCFGWLLLMGSVAAAETTAAFGPPPPPAVVANTPLAPVFLPIPVLESVTDDAGETPTALLPLYASQPLGRVQPELRRVLVLLHDGDRSLPALLDSLLASAGSLLQGAAAPALLLAPQFLTPLDLLNQPQFALPGGENVLRFAPSAWWQGGQSEPMPGLRPLSSFQVLDTLLAIVLAPELFPALEEIVVIGYGFGGSLAQLYAFAGQQPSLAAKRGVRVRTLVMNPPHYLYLTQARPVPQAAPAVSALPRPWQWQDAAATGCPNANDYPYGPERPVPFIRQQGFGKLRLDFATREIIYFVTRLPDAGAPPALCAALAQGADPITRQQAYQAHLWRSFGDGVSSQRFARLETLGSARDALQAPLVQACLWGLPECAAAVPPAP